jgi:hypothetical protein
MERDPQSLVIDGFVFPPIVWAWMGGGARDADFVKKRCSIYLERVRREAVSLEPYLPMKVPSLLDIGCGIAGVDAVLGAYHDVEDFYLLDGTGGPPHGKLGFKEDMKPWADVTVGKALIEANLNTRVHAYTHPDINTTVPVVLSLKSWGFHYPIETYLNLVRGVLAKDGLLVLDLRKGKSGFDTLARAGFSWVDMIEENAKRNRWVFRKDA